MERKDVLVVGGDERQRYLAGELKKKEMDVEFFDQNEEDLFDKLRNSDRILLPIAAKGAVVDHAEEYMHQGQMIFGSVFPVQFQKICQKKGAKLFDYMKDETIAVQNAVATAEGSIAEAIRRSVVNLHGSGCLILGFGRCGEILANKLKGLSCDVTVMARSRAARAKAEAYGYHSMSFDSAGAINSFLFVFNTVPARVVERPFLEKLGKDVVVIDIASAPGGVDLEACSELGLNAGICPNLPARYAPKTSAKILAMAVWKQLMCAERGDEI